MLVTFLRHPRKFRGSSFLWKANIPFRMDLWLRSVGAPPTNTWKEIKFWIIKIWQCGYNLYFHLRRCKHIENPGGTPALLVLVIHSKGHLKQILMRYEKISSKIAANNTQILDSFLLQDYFIICLHWYKNMWESFEAFYLCFMPSLKM